MMKNEKGNIQIKINNGKMKGFEVKDFMEKEKKKRLLEMERKDNIEIELKSMDVKENMQEGVEKIENEKMDK